MTEKVAQQRCLKCEGKAAIDERSGRYFVKCLWAKCGFEREIEPLTKEPE